MAAPAATKITLALVRTTHGIDDPDALVELRKIKLERQVPAIAKVENLDAFAGTLRELYLQGNAIGALGDGLEDQGALMVLALSYNRLQALEGLRDLRSLRILDLSHNAIEQVEAAELPRSLRLLDLTGNPCCEEGNGASYRAAVIAACPELRELDRAAVTTAERRAALGDAAFAAWRRKKQRTVYVPLLGEPGKNEPERRVVPLVYCAGDDLAALAAEFCDDHDLPASAPAELVAMMEAEIATGDDAAPLEKANSRSCASWGAPAAATGASDEGKEGGGSAGGGDGEDKENAGGAGGGLEELDGVIERNFKLLREVEALEAVGVRHNNSAVREVLRGRASRRGEALSASASSQASDFKARLKERQAARLERAEEENKRFSERMRIKFGLEEGKDEGRV